MGPYQILEELHHYLQEAMKKGLGRRGLDFPIDPNDVPEENIRQMCLGLAELFEMINESYRFSEQLSKGDLKAQVSRSNIFAMPLKGLQASLMHLTWQAKQVAAGDLNQQVQFLGEFSDSFNHMINSLREKQVLEHRFKLITEVIGEGILLVDPDGKVIFSNPEAYLMLGYQSDQLLGALMHQLVFKQQPDGTLFDQEENPLLTAIRSGDTYNQEGVFTCESGMLLPVMITSRPIIKDDIIDGAVIAFRDISEQKKYLQSLETINTLLEKQATTDGLTGIYNRIKFNDVLTNEIARAERYDSVLTLILLDIDHFKSINDSYGHSAGDQVLKRLAQLVSSSIRETDTFARWGGEEFVLSAPGIISSEATQFVDRIRQKIEECDFQIPPRVTASFGVSFLHQGDTVSTLTNRADVALYRAKERGRNRVEIATI